MIAALDDDTMSFYRENVEAVWQRLMPAKEQIE
jgi:hypothetical protein